jgi:hypothetical protein
MKPFADDLAHWRDVKHKTIVGLARNYKLKRPLNWPVQDVDVERFVAEEQRVRERLVIDAFCRWASAHGGMAPRQSDWEPDLDYSRRRYCTGEALPKDKRMGFKDGRWLWETVHEWPPPSTVR